MNLLETILNFITTRRKQPVAGDNLCPCPLPEPPIPTLPVEGGYGNDSRRSRSDTLAPLSRPLEADWLGLSGYTLMLSGGIASLYKAFLT